MSIKTVRAEIKTAMKQNSSYEKELTRTEARRIVNEAKKGRVTAGEVAAIRELIGNGVNPGNVFTEALPELRGDAYYMMPGAKAVLDSFVRANTPGGGGGGGGFVTQAIPENPGDAVTLAIPENPGDASIF